MLPAVAAAGRSPALRHDEESTMVEPELDEVREKLERFVGKPFGPPSVAPDPVNVPMMRHWVDAIDDRNPVYLDDEAAKAAGFEGMVAPPAMLQVWSMPRPKIEGIGERGGQPDDLSYDNPLRALDEAGYIGARATNSELEFHRYLRPGEQLHMDTEVQSVSDRKTRALGQGYFVTWVTRYRTEDGELVGEQLFRIFKFDPSTIDLAALGARA